MAAPKARTVFGKPEVDALVDQLLATVGVGQNDDLVKSILVTGLDMDAADVDRLNLKIASQALAEMLESWRVFNPYNERAKVTVFGSARTSPDHPDYKLCVKFGELMGQRDWMSITGAGPGIMTAGIEGFTTENSFGVSIVLPFEANAAEIIRDSDKLVTYRYFFTRKLTFMKESDAFSLFPGGYGTQDELFELLTLIQTGKSYPAPIVLLDHADSTYWSNWKKFVEAELLGGGQIGEADLGMYLHTHDPEEAVEYLCSFYSAYHSVRTVGKKAIIRMRGELSDANLAALTEDFSDIIVEGKIERTEATKAEVRDKDNLDLNRLQLSFDRRSFARFMELIRQINSFAGVSGAAAAENLIHDVSPEEED